MKLCPLCQSRERNLIYPSTLKAVTPSLNQYLCTSNSYGLHGPIYKCKSCHLLYIVDKAPVKSILNRYQEAIDPLYISQEPSRIKTFSRHIRLLSKLKPQKGALLDVGAYTGLFLHLAHKNGWHVSGIEPSHWAVSQAKSNYNLRLKRGLLMPKIFRPNTFDVVTMWDVIEHFTDPKNAINITHKILKPGGVLAITTIDVESFVAKILGKRWPWFMRMHRVYFSKSTLKKMLEDSGYQVIVISPHIRYVSIGYIFSRFRSPTQRFGNKLDKLVKASKMDMTIIPFYVGDLFDLYAVKK